MTKAWYLRFKRHIKGFEPDEDPNFPAVGRSIKHLDVLASAQGWRPLSAFLSEDPDVAIDLLDDEDEDELEAIIKRIGKVRWFKPEEALATVQESVEAIEQLPRRLPLQPKNRARVVAELKDLQETLERAVEEGVRFRFYAEFG
jgi:hypothetical protein